MSPDTDPHQPLVPLREYLLSADVPDSHLSPRWLAERLGMEERELLGGELIIKAGVHAGACLSVTLNERLDFFGGAVNTAARVQGLSHGGDVVITDAVLTDLEAEAAMSAQQFKIVESFDAELRGLPAPIRVHRLRQ